MARRSCRKNAGNKLVQVLDAEKADGMLSEDSTSTSALALAQVSGAEKADCMQNEHSPPPSTLPPLPEIILCKCGVTYDDGGHMLQCDSCWSWSHSSCQGLSQDEAEQTDFVCSACSVAFAEALEPHPPTRQTAEPLPQMESAEHHPAVESPAQESPGSRSGQAPSQNSTASELVTAALPPDPVIASLQSELSRFRQDLLDLQVQTKTQQKFQQVQILSLEEDNALLKDQVLGLRNQLRQLGCHSHSGPRGKQQPIQSHQLQRRVPSTARQSILKSVPGQRPTPGHVHAPPPAQSSFRIIWGTRKSCSVDEVKSVLSGLLAGAEIPSVRRSFKRLGRGMA